MKNFLSFLLLVLSFSFFFAHASYTQSDLEKAVAWMYENGLTSKSTVTDFLPNNTMTREEASKFFSVFAQKEFNKIESPTVSCNFNDLKKADPTLRDSIVNACKLGIFQGYKNNFTPSNNLTNAQAVTVLMRIMVGMMTEPQSSFYANYLLMAKEADLIDSINANAQIKRGDAAVLIYKAHLYNQENGVSDLLNPNIENDFLLKAEKTVSMPAISQDITKTNKSVSLIPMIDPNYSKTNVSIQRTTPIYGLSINASIDLGSNGFVRIILVGKENGIDKEYLVYESTSATSEKQVYIVNNVCEETCVLPDNFVPKKLDVQIQNTSAIRINNINIVDTKNDLPTIIENNIQGTIQQLKSSQIDSKLERVEDMISDNGLSWEAGETSISDMTYQEKKNLFLSGEVPDLQGFEFYIDGIYEVPNQSLQTLSSVGSTNFVRSFDWRNVHGKNRVSPIKNQLQCGSCWAFSVVGTTESILNLYFNRVMNLDLSEQDVLSNSNVGSCAGGVTYDALLYIKNHGVVNEQCFPYSAVNRPSYTKCYTPTNTVKISDRNWLTPTTDEQLKKTIIEKGPLSVSVISLSHAMVLVGFETDTDGRTVWIFKNSRGTTWGDSGYRKIKTNISNFRAYILTNPIYNNGSSSGITCEDNDNDGYCNRGISSSKPSSCPSSCRAEKDCDDSDSDKQAFDAGYNCVEAQENCPSTQHLESNVCVNNTRSCTITNGIGQQTWNGSRGSCTVVSCNNGYQIQGNSCVVATVIPTCLTTQHLENNVCINNTRACTISHGVGQQTRNNNTRGSCTVVSCNNGYYIQGNSCVVQPICPSGQHMENGSCENNTKSCTIANGIGQQTWSNNVRGSCSIVSCNNGYQVYPNNYTYSPYSTFSNTRCLKSYPGCNYPYNSDTMSVGGNSWSICSLGGTALYSNSRINQQFQYNKAHLVCKTGHKLPSLSDFQVLLSLPMTDTSFGFAFIHNDFILDYGYGIKFHGTGVVSGYYRILENNGAIKRMKIEGTCLSVGINGRCTEYSQPTISLDTTTLTSSSIARVRCVEVNCPSDQHYETQSDSCVDNIKACTLTNGIGQQTRTNNAWSTCQVVSCNEGYCKYMLQGTNFYQCLLPLPGLSCNN